MITREIDTTKMTANELAKLPSTHKQLSYHIYEHHKEVYLDVLKHFRKLADRGNREFHILTEIFD